MLDIQLIFIEIFNKYFNKDFNNETTLEKFKKYVIYLQSFIKSEEYLKEDFLNLWNNNIKPQIYKVQQNILDSFINEKEIDDEIKLKKIIENCDKDSNNE